MKNLRKTTQDPRELTQTDVDRIIFQEVDNWKSSVRTIPWDTIALDTSNIANRMIRRNEVSAPRNLEDMIEQSIENHARGEQKFGDFFNLPQ